MTTRKYPALDVCGMERSDLVLALLDDFAPTAVEEHPSSIRAFFSDPRARDAARAVLADRYVVEAIDVVDEDWARRSQENLEPVTVGRITILPRGGHPATGATRHPITLVIPPSMGFGTGHHATTRLCLRALQTRDLNDAVALDVGTGSGVLAIAAVCLGARKALGLDSDADAIEAARENLSLNAGVSNVQFEVADLTTAALPEADVVTANLTGALLARAAPVLTRAVGRRGALIVSGLLAPERAAVLAHFGGFDLAWEACEDDWLGMVLTHNLRYPRVV